MKDTYAALTFSSATKVLALTTSRVVTPKILLGLYTPCFLKTSLVMGMVELTYKSERGIVHPALWEQGHGAARSGRGRPQQAPLPLPGRGAPPPHEQRSQGSDCSRGSSLGGPRVHSSNMRETLERSTQKCGDGSTGYLRSSQNLRLNGHPSQSTAQHRAKRSEGAGCRPSPVTPHGNPGQTTSTPMELTPLSVNEGMLVNQELQTLGIAQ